MPAVRWRSRDGATATVVLQGAQLVSWKSADGVERLYVSERSAYEPGKPIRGGIPVCFPQFADRGPLMQHGFARTREWECTGAGRFALDASPQTLALWPHAFRLELTATIGAARLEMELRVLNPGDGGFAFTAALHTYLLVADAAAARLEGLQGARYVNRGSSAVEVETRESITAAEPIDRVYLATPALTRLHDAGRTLRIEQRGFTDTVVWNPGRERTAQMPDMSPDGYRTMLCVEAAAIEPPVALPPGGEWRASQSISA